MRRRAVGSTGGKFKGFKAPRALDGSAPPVLVKPTTAAAPAQRSSVGVTPSIGKSLGTKSGPTSFTVSKPFKPLKRRPLLVASTAAPAATSATSAVAAATAAAEDIPVKHYFVMYCKSSTKKKKSYEEGVLVLTGKYATLQDMTGVHLCSPPATPERLNLSAQVNNLASNSVDSESLARMKRWESDDGILRYVFCGVKSSSSDLHTR